jgi:integrase
MDYQFLTISNEGNAKNKDKRFNYLDTTGKNWELVYNKYKTADTYGQQTERVPPQLKKIFEKYVKESDLKDGDPLFGQKNNKFYKNFSNEIMRSFKKFTGKDISANILRHSYIADFLSSKKTLNQKKALAERMGHNISTQALYDRIVKELEK